MGRLIDADALLEHIKKLECHAENKKYKQGLNDFLQCYLPQIIDNQPTAYDVEKVVERLEKERICLEDNYGDEVICIGAHDAIDIVKAGGING